MHAKNLLALAVASLCAATAAASCSSTPATTGPPAVAASPVRLAVAGAKNGMASMAASGSHVVVVWTATLDDVMNVHAAVSEDGGISFSAPVRVNDRPGDVAANAEQPPRVAMAGSSVTVVWRSRNDKLSEIHMSRSLDGGRTFAPAARIHKDGLPGARGWISLTMDQAGRAHAVWLDGRDAVMDHGNTHEHASPRQDVYQAIVAPDGSITEAHVARDVCFCCKTAVGIGPSGRVNVAWRHIFPDSMRDMAFATSADGGRNFGELSRVSEDNWHLTGCPEDGPSMAVGPGDTVHLVWPTLVTTPEPQKAVFYSTTNDGRSFSPRLRLSAETQADAAHPQIAMDANGNLAAVWDEQQGDARQVVLRRRAQSAGVFEPAVSVDNSAPGFHPFVVAVEGGFLVAWATGAGDQSAIAIRAIR